MASWRGRKVEESRILMRGSIPTFGPNERTSSSPTPQFSPLATIPSQTIQSSPTNTNTMVHPALPHHRPTRTHQQQLTHLPRPPPSATSSPSCRSWTAYSCSVSRRTLRRRQESSCRRARSRSYPKPGSSPSAPVPPTRMGSSSSARSSLATVS